MPTKKVKSRMLFLTLLIVLSVSLIFFIIQSLNKNLLYFKTPTDIKDNVNITVGKTMRLGGMVKENSLSSKRDEIKFIITDFKNEIIVSYNGAVPNLFLEGKGVIAEGKLKDNKYFIATRILAKHDENYMPPELKGLLKENVK
jgi:cytochrome c-type biogenesis protein CcmE|tara:strand:+ start:210 stop:638 length:429 start_codon:yes stop_codon:yes gene_type:complete